MRTNKLVIAVAALSVLAPFATGKAFACNPKKNPGCLHTTDASTPLAGQACDPYDLTCQLDLLFAPHKSAKSVGCRYKDPNCDAGTLIVPPTEK